MDYSDVFLISAKAREKYEANQLSAIEQAVELIRNQMEYNKRFLSTKKNSEKKNAFKTVQAYEKATKDALTIIPQGILNDVISGCQSHDNYIVTPWEIFKLQYLNTKLEMQRNQKAKTIKRKANIDIAKVLAKYLLDIGMSAFGEVDNIRNEKVRAMIEASAILDLMDKARDLIEEDDSTADEKASGGTDIVKKPNEAKPVDRNADHNSEGLTVEEIGNMSESELNDWMEELLKP